MTARFAIASLISFACLSLGPLMGVAWAGPAEVVYIPIVVKGEKEVEYRGGYRTFAHAPSEHANILELGYGVTDNWFTELEIEQASEDGGPNRVEAWEWENIIVLTERGKYWADLGLFAAYEHTFADGPDKVRIGPMFMKEIGTAVANVNLLFGREVGRDAAHQTSLGYAWQLKWRGRESLEFGLQGLGEVGVFGHLGQDQSHSAGPALFGVKRLGEGRKVSWNAALLGGLNANAPDLTFRTQIEFEMY